MVDGVLEREVLVKLRRINKPLKTKHLASRFHVDRPIMAEVLNELTIKNQIHWHHPQRGEPDKYMGWVKIVN